MAGTKSPGFLKELLIMIHQEKIQVFNTDAGDDLMILATQKSLNLDLDDALRFLAANRRRTCFVTYDNDFSGCGLEIKTPGRIVHDLILPE